MNIIDISVGPRTDGTWCVRRGNTPHPCAIMPTWGEAVAIARDLAQKAGGKLKVLSEPEAIRKVARVRRGSPPNR